MTNFKRSSVFVVQELTLAFIKFAIFSNRQAPFQAQYTKLNFSLQSVLIIFNDSFER